MMQRLYSFKDPPTTEIYTLSLHDALPISPVLRPVSPSPIRLKSCAGAIGIAVSPSHRASRSEEHTSELQSQFHLVCRLLLEKKNKVDYSIASATVMSDIRSLYLHISAFTY